MESELSNQNIAKLFEDKRYYFKRFVSIITFGRVKYSHVAHETYRDLVKTVKEQKSDIDTNYLNAIRVKAF